jgi:hypothetical protein
MSIAPREIDVEEPSFKRTHPKYKRTPHLLCMRADELRTHAISGWDPHCILKHINAYACTELAMHWGQGAWLAVRTAGHSLCQDSQESWLRVPQSVSTQMLINSAAFRHTKCQPILAATRGTVSIFDRLVNFVCSVSEYLIFNTWKQPGSVWFVPILRVIGG